MTLVSAHLDGKSLQFFRVNLEFIYCEAGCEKRAFLRSLQRGIVTYGFPCGSAFLLRTIDTQWYTSRRPTEKKLGIGGFGICILN